jgi:hypothetical protein
MGALQANIEMNIIYFSSYAGVNEIIWLRTGANGEFCENSSKFYFNLWSLFNFKNV